MDAQDLKKHQWEHRIIVVSSPTFGNSDAEVQLELLEKNKNALIERKLLVYHVTNAGFTLNFEEEIFVSENSQSAISGFNVSLIGLDGNEKYHATQVQDPEKFFSLIDAMPMRQAELQKKNQGQ